jgi:pimeloyl-ACP methyl ester carboxylesterase
MAAQQQASPRRRTAPTACAALCGAFAVWSPALRCAGAAPPPADRRPLLVGSIELKPCPGVSAYCGKLDRPLDPTAAIPGRISIHFEYYPHTAAGPPVGTLVATEGGPGYAATESRDEYLALFEPLRSRRDFLLMDNRGTGQSEAAECRELQSNPKWTVEMIGACGRHLGDSASLYSTAYAADDLAAILEALHIRRIDLYGDSYGTFFEQVFAVRHPNLLRSIVLDGAYALNGVDYPWYPNYAPAMRDKFDIACRRFAPCAQLDGSSIDHIRPVLEDLRAHPFPARAMDSDGKEQAFIADPSQLAIVMYGNEPAFATVRELDAAARAFTGGDRAPLLRLMAESISGVDPTGDIAQSSAAAAEAVTCQDPPQIFDMRLPPALRAADRDRAIAERKRTRPDTYAPFTIDEYRGMPLDYTFIDQCVDWPVSPSTHPASHVVEADVRYPDVPALIVSGELDDLTTLADGAAVAAAFKQGRQIRVANSFHVNALPHARSTCAARIVRRFIATLDAGDTSCTAQVPPLRLVPRFARHAAELEAAAALPGNRADASQLRSVSAAVMTAGDVLARLSGNSTGQGVGLRGGSFRISNDTSITHVVLDQVRWTEDLAVSGTIDKPTAHTGMVHALLRWAAPDARTGEIAVEWPQGVANSVAAIRGKVADAAVIARTGAP